MDGIPIRTLSTGDTFRLLRGTRAVSAGIPVMFVFALDESIFIFDMLDESAVMPAAALSPCWLCVGVGAAAPVPYWLVESVFVMDDESVFVVVRDADGVVVVLPDIDEESVIFEEDGVVVVDGVDIDEESVIFEEDGVVVLDGVDIDEESVVIEEDGVVVVDEEGVVVTSPVDVECEPSFDTRMWLLVWPSTTAGERAIAAIAMSLIFMCSP